MIAKKNKGTSKNHLIGYSLVGTIYLIKPLFFIAKIRKKAVFRGAHNLKEYPFLKYIVRALSLPLAVENVFAESAEQVSIRHANNDGSNAILWVILSIWFAVSLYLLYIDRKITRLEKHETRN
jgi:hypothetical protein